MFHRAITGASTANLDLFFTKPNQMKRILGEASENTDITVIEGVMGYYDGMQLGKDTASSYDVAKQTKTPVILAISCKGMSLSLAAVIQGIVSFRKDSNVKGILLNGIAKGMYERIKPVVEEETNIPVVGYLPPLKNFQLESRHLGLVLPEEITDLEEQLTYLSDIARESIDLDKIIEIANEAPEIEVCSEFASVSSSKVRIGYAYDKAFCFYYQENFRMLQSMGAELIPFSPLEDQTLPEGISGMLLGGGYPEVYARQLSENTSMISAIKQAINHGIPCVAECGGFMYLHKRMQDKAGDWYPMVGVIDGECFQTKKLVRFGYVTLTSEMNHTYGSQGEAMKGHEFHYWDSTNTGNAYTATKTSSALSYNTIHVDSNLFAGYPHLYYPSNPKFAWKYLLACEEYQEKQ